MKKSALAPVVATGVAAALVYALAPRRPRIRAGQVAVITGGSRGLGLALAHRFGRAGLRLVLAARKQDELGAAQRDLVDSGDVLSADDILPVACDLTDPAEAVRLVDRTLERFGALDVLINNAGIIEVGAVEDQPLEAYERAMRTNFFAALYTVHAALLCLLAHGGAIVNISSVGGKIPVPHLAPYVAAKFALTGFSETLHAELRYRGVRVTTVCPGLMRTGGEAHAIFLGQSEKEQRWFNLGAKTPGIAVSATHAANRIFDAVNAGRAEITISPQAWLAARMHGMWPECVQQAAAVVNRVALPEPLARLD